MYACVLTSRARPSIDYNTVLLETRSDVNYSNSPVHETAYKLGAYKLTGGACQWLFVLYTLTVYICAVSIGTIHRHN